MLPVPPCTVSPQTLCTRATCPPGRAALESNVLSSVTYPHTEKCFSFWGGGQGLTSLIFGIGIPCIPLHYQIMCTCCMRIKNFKVSCGSMPSDSSLKPEPPHVQHPLPLSKMIIAVKMRRETKGVPCCVYYVPMAKESPGLFKCYFINSPILFLLCLNVATLI